MSLETWKQEFYPTEASQVEEADALEHSLRKWIGLRKENLDKHEVQTTSRRVPMERTYLTEKHSGRTFGIDMFSCALCQHYEYTACQDCPLSQHLGERCDEEDDSPYSLFYCDNNNVEPMISTLQACLDKEQQETSAVSMEVAKDNEQIEN